MQHFQTEVVLHIHLFFNLTSILLENWYETA